MLEKLFERSFAILLIIMFFICATVYNIGYFATLGDSLWYFFYIPTSIADLLKTGLIMLIPLIMILLVFKPILINPAFNGVFPGANILLTIAILVLISNLLYFVVFSNTQNRSLSLVLQGAFFTFSLVCFMAIVYYFLSSLSTQDLLLVFLLSLIPITFLIGVIDAKTAINASYNQTKSQILLRNDKVVSANILRSFDSGMFLMINGASSVNFIAWEEIKEVKFKKVSGF